MQEKSSHKAMLSPSNISAPKSETGSVPVKSSYWYPGDETHAAVYIDAFSQEEANKLYSDYLKR